MKPRHKVLVAMALSDFSVAEAFNHIDYKPPVLVVGKKQVGVARRLAMQMGIAYRVDRSIDRMAWRIEWNGRSAGSIGE